MKLPKKFPLILLASPLIFSLELVFLKWAFTKGGLDPISFTANRSVFGAIFLAFFGLVPLARELKTDWKALVKWVLVLTAIRATGDFLYFICQNLSTPGAFSLLLQLSAFSTGFFAFLMLKERLPPREIAGGLIMVFGALFVILSKGNGAVSVGFGEALTLAFVVLIGIGNAFSKKAIDSGIDRNAILFGATLFSIPVFYLLSPILFGKNPLATFATDLPYALGGALFFAANTLVIFYCFEHFGPSRTQIASISNVIFSAIFAFLLLGISPSLTDFAGGAIIIAGVAVFLGAGKKNVKS